MLSSKTLRRAAIICLALVILFSQIRGVGGAVGGLDKHLKAGDDAMMKGRANYDTAIKHYTTAIETIAPDQLFKAYYKRAEVYQLQKKYEEALADLNQWVKLKPNKSAYTSRIKVNVLLANFGAVAEDYQQLVSIDPKKAADHQQKAQTYSNLQEQLVYIEQNSAAIKSGQLDHGQRQQFYKQCVQLLGPIVQEHCRNNEALILKRIECALESHDHNLVRTEVNKLLERNSNNLQALYFKAKSFNMMGAVDAARSHIRKCLTINQDHSGCVALHKQIKAYEKQNKAVQSAKENRQWQAALDAVDEAFRIDPDGPSSNEFRKDRCELYLKLRKVQEGLAACTACVQADGDNNPGLLDVFLTRSEIHILNDDLDAAAQDIQKARELDQRNQKVHQAEQNLQRLRKMAERKDYYKILGVPKTASDKDIKSAYRKLAMQYHPDKTHNMEDEEKEKAAQLFRDIAEAKDILSDEEKRGKYDRGEDLNENQNQHRHHHHNPFGQHFNFHFG
mmetsp:Transcript_74838/g.132175  ORF Transcript_74838/g.132175 Transcript_74838/m.132175 type:complete len:505 (-) Transcript_74838:234-1748(-)